MDIRAGDQFTLTPTREVIDGVRRLFGEGALTLGGRR